MLYEPFKFCWVTDTHNCDKDVLASRYYRQILSIYSDPEYGGVPPVGSPSKLKDALEQAQTDGCDLFMHTGDVNESWYGGHDAVLGYLNDTLDFIDAYGIERHVVLGNHDYPNVTRADWLTAVGKAAAHYSFSHWRYHFIIVDFNYDVNGDPYDTTYTGTEKWYLPTAMRNWLIADLDANKDKITFIFTHQKASTHGEKMGAAELCLEEADGDAFRDICEHHGRGGAVFQGHAHASDYSLINGVRYYTLMGAVDDDGDDEAPAGIYTEGSDENAFAIVSIDSSGILTITPYANADDQSKWTTLSFQLGGSMPGQLKVTIDYTKVAGALSDFPVVITENNIPDNFWNYVKSDGSDIWVQGIVSDEMTVWDSELQYFDKSNKKMELWVKVPSLSATADTIFYVNYGDTTLDVAAKTDVWDSDFMAVHHMNGDPDDGAPQFVDSTASDMDGTAGTGLHTSNVKDGPFGKAIDFDWESYNKITLPAGSEWDLGTGAFTIECLFKPEGFNGTAHYQQLISIVESGSGLGQLTMTFSPSNKFSLKVQDYVDSAVLSPVLNTSTWYYAVGVRAANGDITLYINTVDVTSGSPNEPHDIGVDSGARCAIGQNCDVDNYWANAYIAEVRVSKLARSTDWLETTHENLLNNSDFYAAEEWQIPYSDYMIKTADVETSIANVLDDEIPSSPTSDSINDHLAAIKVKTDGLNFSGIDIKATLAGELVKLAADGLAAVSKTGPTGDPSGWTFQDWLNWLSRRFANKVNLTLPPGGEGTLKVRNDADNADLSSQDVDETVTNQLILGPVE